MEGTFFSKRCGEKILLEEIWKEIPSRKDSSGPPEAEMAERVAAY